MMKKRKVPMRMCIGCKQMKPKKDLLRIVQPKEGAQSARSFGESTRAWSLCLQEHGLLTTCNEK